MVGFNSMLSFLRRGWFPFSYTRVLPESDNEKLKVKYVTAFTRGACQQKHSNINQSLRPLFSYPPSLHHGKSSSTGNLLESDASLPIPDYGLTARLLAQSLAQTRPRPYSMAGFGTQVGTTNTCNICETG